MLDLAGVAAVIAHRTTIVPHQPVSTLITIGDQPVLCNPMYSWLAIMVTGGPLPAGTWWPLLFLPFASLAVDERAISEETYLGKHHGPIYADYRYRVRRWL